MNSSSNEIQQNLEENIKEGDMLPIIIIIIIIIITSNTHIWSFAKGSHIFKHCFKPVIGEHLFTKIEPSNPVIG